MGTGRSSRAHPGGPPLASLALAAVAIALGPVAIGAAAGAAGGVAGQLRWHWWQVLAGAAVATGAAVAVQLAMGLSPLELHYSGFLIWLSDPSLAPTEVAAALVPTLPLAVPGGVAIGSAMVGVTENLARGAEWHPLEQRRGQVGRVQREREVARLLVSRSAQNSTSSVPLGVVRAGDLDQWREGSFVVLPSTVASLGLGIVGAPGSGKTVTIERIVMSCAARGRRVVLVDAKGTDPELPERMAAAYVAGARGRPVRLQAWPTTPIDAWRGDPTSVANRLMAVQDYDEPYWKSVASTAVRLALSAPGEPCRDSAGFLARLTPAGLKKAYAGHLQAETVAALLRRPDGLDGVRLRYAGFFAALDGRFDGSCSYDDADLTLMALPTLAAREDGEAAVLMLLADFAHWATARKPRRGDDVTLIVDEFSAVTGAATLVIDLAERVRDVGGQVVVSAQSYEGLGNDDDERRRMVGALGAGLILHRCVDPDELLKAAGTVRSVEQSWQLQDTSSSGMGNMRMAYRMRIEPDAVRQAGVGEAWVISSGRALHAQMIATADDSEVRNLARYLLARRAPEELTIGQPADDQSTSDSPEEPSSPDAPAFLDELDGEE